LAKSLGKRLSIESFTCVDKDAGTLGDSAKDRDFDLGRFV